MWFRHKFPKQWYSSLDLIATTIIVSSFLFIVIFSYTTTMSIYIYAAPSFSFTLSLQSACVYFVGFVFFLSLEDYKTKNHRVFVLCASVSLVCVCACYSILPINDKHSWNVNALFVLNISSTLKRTRILFLQIQTTDHEHEHIIMCVCAGFF